MKTTNKLRRMVKILSMALMIFLQIYWYKFRKKPEKDWDMLWVKIGKSFRDTLFELEGLLIKIGQLLSIRADLLPHGFISQIQDLTDNVPPSDWEEIQNILEGEWEEPIEHYFDYVDQKAVASASIGEVYKGVLKNGKEVAIKVQRPNIQSIINTDFRTLGIIIWFADHFIPLPKGFINLKVLFKELKQVIEREVDFSLEKNTLLFFKERFKNEDSMVIPDVYSDISTSRVLVMEWVDGIRLTDESGLDQLEVSREELAHKLIELFLPQWLEPGTFHADPHTGNVLVSKEGKIILLDFGMTAEISKRDASEFQGLIESLLSKNYARAVECLMNLGFLLPEADASTMERLLAELMSFKPQQLKEMDIMALKLEMNDLIQALPIQVPTRFVFLGRSVVTMEGILRGLATEKELAEILKPVFLDWLQKQGNNKWSFLWYWLQSQPLFKIIHSFTEFFKLPQKLEDIKENEQRRHFQFTIYENYKKQMFQLTIAGLGGVAFGIYTDHQLILQLSAGTTIVSALGYVIFGYKLKKWLKYMHKKRR
ncbi:AarF/UbiB family protein [Salipaludibacillus sp. CUR1]|uniref:ABC1 kinase family protein n=1 Tax=Salipaludibacillus sp. CUR1 TaxID=2820003 RepID=UPI001E42A6C3|nr:AarF/UbiB family protein [Salipaludibacillus sp. CUR1]MCE7792958.1 AarF/UbiB family protein [Salipaludibacillus sp. CUR1]